jgi:flavin-binding protein dodecin
MPTRAPGCDLLVPRHPGGAGSAGGSQGCLCGAQENSVMTEHVYKLVELVGTSGTSVSDAIQNAVTRAAATVRNIKWFEVVQVRGEVKDGKVGHYQVTLKVGFTLDEG